ncbi:MAG: HlyC/CorC family transporter [Peptostreptococcaceae bacterium]|nr:HlyC/CorC family transporter [Peptostreptococcaceae bacterium]
MTNTPDPSLPIGLFLIIIILLLLLNAFFAAIKVSISTVNRNKIKNLAKEGNSKAISLMKILDQPDKVRTSIQNLITMGGFIASALTAIGIANVLGNYFLENNVLFGSELAVLVSTSILIYINIVFFEIFPKRLAINHAEVIALNLSKPILFLTKLVSPFNWLLLKSVNCLLRITRQKIEVDEEEFSEDDVRSMLDVGQETGVLNEQGKRMINSIFAFDDKVAYEIMTPRTDVFYIDVNDPSEEYLEELMELRYSRIPVYDDDSDNIIGIINIKDYLIKARELGFENVDLREILRKPYFVPETKNLETLFFDLQTSKQHIAILIDEYGGFSGIVTMEDLIEEIVGEIDDEYDQVQKEIEIINGNTFRISGFMSLDDLNKELHISLHSDNSETIGGLIIDILGEIPDNDDHEERIIEYNNCIFTIESIKERRIETIRLHILSKEEEELKQESILE